MRHPRPRFPLRPLGCTGLRRVATEGGSRVSRVALSRQVGQPGTEHGGGVRCGPPQYVHRLVLADQVGKDVWHQVRRSIVTSFGSDNSE